MNNNYAGIVKWSIITILSLLFAGILYLHALNGRYTKIDDEECLFDKWTCKKIDYDQILEKKAVSYGYKDNIENLYEVLKDSFDLGSEQDFRESLGDVNNRRNLYNAIKDDYEVGSEADFNNSLGYGDNK